jgi:uncharacterized protein (DUF697 family)
MLPRDDKHLNKAREECRAMVLRRAATSAGASVIPLPGLDIAADVGLLMKLLPAINRKFGLTPEQIEKLDPQSKLVVYALISRGGKSLVGRAITKKVVLLALKRVGIRMTAKQAAKYLPFAGQIASAFLGFGAMMYLGTSHIDECYQVAKAAMDADSDRHAQR